MTHELLVKRLMKQASVSVLAGLLLSSAAVAGGSAGQVSEPGTVSVGVDETGPEVSVDPVDPGDFGNDDGDYAGNDDEGSYGDGSDGDVSDGDPSDGDSSDGDPSDGDDGGVSDGDDGTDSGDGDMADCADCSGIPDIDIGPVAFDGLAVEDGMVSVTGAPSAGPVRGGAPEQRGNGAEAGGIGGRDFGNDAGRGAGRERDLGIRQRELVK